MTITVYGNWHSTCTQAVMTAVAEKQAKVDLVSLDMAKGEHKSKENLARNPFGKIPTLHDSEGNLQIIESRAMVRYLNDKFTTGNSLIPSTPAGRAILEQWAALECGTINPQLSAICYQRVWGPMMNKSHSTDMKAIETAIDSLAIPLDMLEKQLASHGGKYLLGEQYSIVDIQLAPYIRLVSQTPEKTKVIDARPHVKQYVQNLLDRPSYHSVLKNIQ